MEDKTVLQLRWDHADLLKYYNMTFLHLQPILDELFDLDCIVDSESSNEEIISIDKIDNIYDKIVNALTLSASASVPIHRKNFYKFWWSQELDCLKDRAMESDKLWKAAGRPRSGAIYTTRTTVLISEHIVQLFEIIVGSQNTLSLMVYMRPC